MRLKFTRERRVLNPECLPLLIMPRHFCGRLWSINIHILINRSIIYGCWLNGKNWDKPSVNSKPTKIGLSLYQIATLLSGPNLLERRTAGLGNGSVWESGIRPELRQLPRVPYPILLRRFPSSHYYPSHWLLSCWGKRKRHDIFMKSFSCIFSKFS